MPRSALLLCLGLVACPGSDDETLETDSDTDVASASPCPDLGLAVAEFDPGAGGLKRRDLAEDFHVDLLDDTRWTWSENWTGCDAIVVLPHDLPISQINADSVWTTSVPDLIERSPRNARYIFVSREVSREEAQANAEALQASIEATLGQLSDEDAAWWRERLMVSADRAFDMGNWVGDAIREDRFATGVGIDRFQRVRGIGSLADVKAYNANAGSWPYERRLGNAANEIRYFNFEAERQAGLDAVEATEIQPLDGSVVEEFVEFQATLPDAATMQGFDTLEIDILFECPDPDLPEFNNCGAWDYLSHLWLLQDVEGQDEPVKVEMARFITTYHRESRWVVDASQALAWLQDGGTRDFYYEWAPPWNKQPTGVTLTFRLSNQGKGVRPVAALPLHTGGNLGDNYNAGHPDVDVQVPAGAARVELRSIITGHGGATQNCAEFCNHGHTFSLGGQEFTRQFDNVGTQDDCETKVDDGVVPNQWGTWWYGRGGWCPGQRIEPWTEDVTSLAPAGSTVSVGYRANLNGREPPTGDYGNIRMSSWLVVYE